MRNAFMLLGVMVFVISAGAFFAFYKKADAPHKLDAESINQSSMKLTLTSPVFKEGERIPAKFTCDADNVSPELHIENAPSGTKTFVLVMDDPDIPEEVKKARGIQKFDHWVLYNIPGDTKVIPEGVLLGSAGLNSRGEAAYTGPCPPDREHRYVFRLYALKTSLNFLKMPTLYDVEEAAKGGMIDSATLVGRYERVTREGK